MTVYILVLFLKVGTELNPYVRSFSSETSCKDAFLKYAVGTRVEVITCVKSEVLP